jgi:bacteriocin-like protein
MSEPNSADLIATPEELTDADLEQVTGGNKPATQTAAAGGTGKVQVKDFHFTKLVD